MDTSIKVEARNCAFESLMSQKISMNVSKLRSDLANLHTKTSQAMTGDPRAKVDTVLSVISTLVPICILPHSTGTSY